MTRIKIILTGIICFLTATSFAYKSTYGLDYPIGDEAGLASVFGPRALIDNSAEGSWFHPEPQSLILQYDGFTVTMCESGSSTVFFSHGERMHEHRWGE
jgi:hypothetical protein